MCHSNASHLAHDCGTSHVTNGSWHWVTARINASWHIWIRHSLDYGTSRINVSCLRIRDGPRCEHSANNAICHVTFARVTYMHASWNTYKCVIGHIWMRHVCAVATGLDANNEGARRHELSANERYIDWQVECEWCFEGGVASAQGVCLYRVAHSRGVHVFFWCVTLRQLLEPVTNKSSAADVLRQLLETATGDSYWRQLLETAAGDSCWRQLLETAARDSYWQVLHTYVCVHVHVYHVYIYAYIHIYIYVYIRNVYNCLYEVSLLKCDGMRIVKGLI